MNKKTFYNYLRKCIKCGKTYKTYMKASEICNHCKNMKMLENERKRIVRKGILGELYD